MQKKLKLKGKNSLKKVREEREHWAQTLPIKSSLDRELELTPFISEETRNKIKLTC